MKFDFPLAGRALFPYSLGGTVGSPWQYARALAILVRAEPTEARPNGLTGAKMAVDTTYDIPAGTVQKLTDAAVSTILMAQNMSKYPCAVYFQDTEPDPSTDRPDVIWGGGAYEESFPIPNGPLNAWGTPAGNAPFTSMKIIQTDGA